MKKKYLLHFVHDHLTFRWLEFDSLAQNHCLQYRLVSPIPEKLTRPYIVIELDDDRYEPRLIQASSRAYLLQGLYEIWAESTKSVQDLNSQVRDSPRWMDWVNISAMPDQDYRIDCRSFGSKLSQQTKVEWIEQMTFFDDFKCAPNLNNYKQVYCIFEMNTKDASRQILSKDFALGKLLIEGTRNVVKNFSIKERKFIANTTMDPLISAIMANAARINQNSIVYDPFVGSGGLIITAADMGAYVIGSDIDWSLLHGKSRPSRKGQLVRDHDENVQANMAQYGLLDKYLDVAISDITRPFLRPDFSIDAIVTDPPYGVRECTERIGAKRANRPMRDDCPRYPSKVNHKLVDLLGDLLNLAARNLRVHGRLVYFLPISKTGKTPEEYIPSHPCLKLMSSGDQTLTEKTSRLLIVMEKIRDPRDGDTVLIPEALFGENFRDVYFTPRQKYQGKINSKDG